jgi:hypothetical protein
VLYCLFFQVIERLTARAILFSTHFECIGQVASEGGKAPLDGLGGATPGQASAFPDVREGWFRHRKNHFWYMKLRPHFPDQILGPSQMVGWSGFAPAIEPPCGSPILQGSTRTALAEWRTVMA